MFEQTNKATFIHTYCSCASSNVCSSVSYTLVQSVELCVGALLIKVRYYGESTLPESYLFNIQCATPNHAFDNVWILRLKKRLFWTTMQYINLLLSNTPYYSPRIALILIKACIIIYAFFLLLTIPGCILPPLHSYDTKCLSVWLNMKLEYLSSTFYSLTLIE